MRVDEESNDLDLIYYNNANVIRCLYPPTVIPNKRSQQIDRCHFRTEAYVEIWLYMHHHHLFYYFLASSISQNPKCLHGTQE